MSDIYGVIRRLEGTYPITVGKAVYVAPRTSLGDLLPLADATLVTFGDSIVHGSSGTPLGTMLGQRWNMAVTNYGVPGSTISGAMPFDHEGMADYITVWGGVNDFANAVPLGDMNSERVRGQTFYGSLHWACRKLLAEHPSAKITFFTPMQMSTEAYNESNLTNSNGDTLAAFADAVIEVCAYYSIPVLDLYRTGGICPTIAEQKSAFTSDGIHPTTAGYERLLHKVEWHMLGL